MFQDEYVVHPPGSVICNLKLSHKADIVLADLLAL